MVAAFEPSERNDLPYIGVDDLAGAKKAAEHLLSAGHRSIAFIGDSTMSSAQRRRRNGYDFAMAAANISVEERIIVEGDGSTESGRLAVEYLFIREKVPTAFMCVNDNTEIGVMSALQGRGYHVPSDFSVTGFDDIPQVTFTNPQLTTIRQPRKQIGQSAIKMLLDGVGPEGKQGEREQLIMPELIVRGSVANPRG